jgi:hypothetical protein
MRNGLASIWVEAALIKPRRYTAFAWETEEEETGNPSENIRCPNRDSKRGTPKHQSRMLLPLRYGFEWQRHVCMYVCMYICMYVCMYVCIVSRSRADLRRHAGRF